MPDSSGFGGSSAAETAVGASDVSSGELIARLTQQSTDLIRNEFRLAQAEMTAKAKHAGVGAGLFGGAGIVALFGIGTLIATAILALSLVVPGWLAALIVTLGLFAVAAAGALVGKKQVAQATPAAPRHAIDGVKRDIETLKGGSTS